MQRIGLQPSSDQADASSKADLGRLSAEATDGNPLGIQDLPPPSPPERLRWLGLFAFVLIALGIAATLTVTTIAKEKKSSLLNAEEKRLQQSVLGRANVLKTWLEGQLSTSKRLTDSHVFRLFIADLTHRDLALPLPRSLRDQQPYFQQLMADFSRQHDLMRATVLRDDGAILMSSPGPALPVVDTLTRLQGLHTDQKYLLSPIRRLDDQDGRLVVDASIAFPKAQTEAGISEASQAFLVLTLPVGQILKRALTNRNIDPDSERITLFQEHNEAIDQLWMTAEGIKLESSLGAEDSIIGKSIAFGRRDDAPSVYSLGEPVEEFRWTLYHAVDARAALQPVHDFIRVAAVISLLAVLTLTATFIALWSRHDAKHHRELADVYRAYAKRADRQRQFLQSVTTSISDWLMVSSSAGEIIYANPAFSNAIRRHGAEVSGRRWDELVDETPVALSKGEDFLDVMDCDRFDVVEIGGDRRVVSSIISNLHNDIGAVQGTVRIVRDHTDMMVEKRRRSLSLVQTIDALIQAIERRDPFLLGHTRRVRTHAIAVGGRLGLSTDDLANLALAASLSQIGKIFIPDDILTKPDRHGPEEEKIMRDHILHAVGILERIDFDTPVADVLIQMHERLDGSGYPHGLTGMEISLSARILAIADVFCARTAPRSYRDRLSAGKTLYHLANNDHRYDLKVVAALAEIVGQSDEIDGDDDVEETFLDASVWRQRNCDRVHEPA